MQAKFQVVPYVAGKHTKGFQELYLAWLLTEYKVEPEDDKIFGALDEVVAKNFGWVAEMEHDGVTKLVGTILLLRNTNSDPRFQYEIAKLRVTPEAQGKGLAKQLCQNCVDKVKELGGSFIYLETASKLKPAIQLYEKLGFYKVDDFVSPYTRADYVMVRKIDS